MKYFQDNPEPYLPRGMPTPMNTVPPSILFMVPTEAVAAAPSKHHIGGNDVVTIGGGELIPTIFIAQS